MIEYCNNIVIIYIIYILCVHKIKHYIIYIIFHFKNIYYYKIAYIYNYEFYKICRC